MSLKTLDGQLINNWYIIALSREVKRGEKIARTLYGHNYVIFRNQEEEIGVLEDRCIHRGAKLSEGTCHKSNLRCPYHGWSFGTQGELKEIPSEGPESSKQVLSKNWRVPSLPVVEQDGCIWVWPGDLELKTTAPTWRFPNFGNSKWAQYFMITDFNDEVTRLVENFMDVPHTVFVHSKWFRNRKLLKVPIQVDVGFGRVKVNYQQPNDSIGFMESLLNPKRAPMVHTDEFIFPNITRVDYSFGSNGFIINSQCTPIDRFRSRVFTWIAYRVGPLTHPLKPFMQFYTRKVIQQDVDIIENLGSNFQRFGEMNYKSTAADELHIAIDRMRAQGVTDQRQAIEPRYQREREFWI